MKLRSTIDIYAGGPGSGCNPSAGKCGRTSNQEKVTGLTSSKAIEDALLERSKSGGAWVATSMPFAQPGDPITFHKFRSPDSVAYKVYETMNGAQKERGIAWQGKFVPWPKKLVLKEQQDAFKGDK